MNNTSKTLTLIGCGKMGSALLKGWLDAELAFSYNVVKPSPLTDDLAGHKNIGYYANITDAAEQISTTDILMLAVKPQMMDEICEDLKPHVSTDTMIISIATGKTVRTFEGFFGSDQPIVRTMPNTPTAIGKGVTAAVSNTITDAQKSLTEQLFKSAGMFAWLENEATVDAVAALSGSGPAYIFHLIETLTAAGIHIGLEPAFAEKLARQTVIGSAALADADHSVPASVLRQNVTSPGGGTAEGLKVLMNGELQDIYNKALDEAFKRHRALNKG